MGFLLQKDKDFVTLSSQGMQVLALGNSEKKVAKDESGQDLMLHSLNSVNYLKTHPTNCI